ncbi:Uu.00g015810.m01.CDS01 [Anthostomella pinea]|uniref:Uu.00g015810.m01.CDS01 n=1 Tax=Anthostomella pinea TaxID=933095 RepID=A0AAI8VYL2_9PEZI|nr:Uu.00g015810.m01.CDS01 [Anthostomella pinea]
MATSMTPSQPPPSGPGSRLRIPATTSASNNTTTTTKAGAGPETVVDSPASPSSTNALARFEFELGRGNEGTKILMVEWKPDSGLEPPRVATTTTTGWVVSWEGKTTTFSLSERDASGAASFLTTAAAAGPTQRVYFLLPSDAPIPPVVTITHAATSRVLNTKCMPAIFAPGLGVSQRDAGKRGVLHTIWAKKRLAQLEDEVRAELADNAEGVGLEMAVQEREWIIDHFGLVGVDPLADGVDEQRRKRNNAGPGGAGAPPQSPRSPVGGRLGEKLRGLRLSTSLAELASSTAGTTNANMRQQHPYQSLSPDTSHTAVPRTAVPVVPGGGGGGGGVASLAAVMDGTGSKQQPASAPVKETEDELFALPMSPRSPEMKTSPFSFLK